MRAVSSADQGQGRIRAREEFDSKQRKRGAMGTQIAHLPSQAAIAHHRRSGYLPWEKRCANVFFQLVARRYERGSLLITTNQVVTHARRGRSDGLFNDSRAAGQRACVRLRRRARPQPSPLPMAQAKHLIERPCHTQTSTPASRPRRSSTKARRPSDTAGTSRPTIGRPRIGVRAVPQRAERAKLGAGRNGTGVADGVVRVDRVIVEIAAGRRTETTAFTLRIPRASATAGRARRPGSTSPAFIPTRKGIVRSPSMFLAVIDT